MASLLNTLPPPKRPKCAFDQPTLAGSMSNITDTERHGMFPLAFKGPLARVVGRAGGNSLQLCLSGHTIDRRIGVKSQRGLRGQVGKLAGTPSGLGWKLALNHKKSFGGRSVRRDGMKGKLRRVGNQGQWEKVKLRKKFGWSTNGPTTRRRKENIPQHGFAREIKICCNEL